jgi:DNA repair exonuclease SbcCD nuclease subunit
LKALRFLQFSDVHLDSPLGSTKLRLPPEKRRRLQADILQTLRRVPELVREACADVVLCPGDLWEEEAIRMESAAELFEIFASVGVPVIIAPGNHDYFHPLSYYDRAHFQRKVGRAHPPNVYIFTGTAMATLCLEHWRDDVVFHGSCFTRSTALGSHEAFIAPKVVKDKLNIALVHGSQVDSPFPAADRIRRDETPSFCSRDIVMSGYDYVALGHYHAYSKVEDGQGRIRAAYSGVFVARGLDETRDHFVIVGEVQPGGVASASWELVRVDPHRIVDIEVELDPQVRSQGEILTRILAAFEQHEVCPQDIVYVRLTGQVASEFEMFALDERPLEQHCWHAVVDWGDVERGYDVDALRHDVSAAKTVVGQFVARTDEIEATARTRRNEGELEIVRLARMIGLDALHGKEIRLRHALE